MKWVYTGDGKKRYADESATVDIPFFFKCEETLCKRSIFLF